jgi:ribosomal protein L37AE/L43A
MTFESSCTIRDLASRFGDDASRRAALADLRWSDGFVCPGCGGTAAWHESLRGLMTCRTCGHEVSPTGDTLLHRSHAPLPDWFATAWASTPRSTYAPSPWRPRRR